MAGKDKFILMIGEKVVWLFSPLSSTRHKVEISFNTERQNYYYIIWVRRKIIKRKEKVL